MSLSSGAGRGNGKEPIEKEPESSFWKVASLPRPRAEFLAQSTLA